MAYVSQRRKKVQEINFDDEIQAKRRQQASAKFQEYKPVNTKVNDISKFVPIGGGNLRDISPSVKTYVAEAAAKKSNTKPVDIREAVKAPTKEALKSPVTQFAAGLAESTIPRAVSSMQKLSTGKAPLVERMKVESKPYSNAVRTIGTIAGELATQPLTYGLIGKSISGASALQKIGSPFLRNVIGGQIADTLIQTPSVIISGAAEGQSAGDIIKNVAKEQAMDLAGNVAFGGAETALKLLKNAIRRPAVKAATEAAEAIPLQKIQIDASPTVRPSTTQGRYTIKNPAYEKAVREYNDAIEQIQNHFQTNWLTDAEVSRIKPELGIDLDDIIGHVEAAEKGVPLPGADTMRLRRAAGAASDRVYRMGERVAGQADSNVAPIGGRLDDTAAVPGTTPIGGKAQPESARNVAGNNRTLKDYIEEIVTAQSHDGSIRLSDGRTIKIINKTDGTWSISVSDYPDTTRGNFYVPLAYQQDGLKTMDDAIASAAAYATKTQPKPISVTAHTGFAPISGRTQPRIYGEQPKGDIPEGMKERGYSRNIRTDEAMPEDIRQSFDDSPLTYKQITNDETLKKAQDIFAQSEESATAELYRSLGNKEFQPETVPLSKMIAQEALANGNVEKARQVLSETANRLTEAGQFSQAAKILREADPETFLYTMQKQLKKLNTDGLKQYGKKWHNIDLTPDEITAIQNIPRGNQQAYETVWEQIGNRIAKELPSTGMEKFDAWRRMAMLLNPKTHIRNTVGNVIMAGMRKTSDTIGAALEKLFVPKGERTKSFGWSLNKGVTSKVDETWDTVKKDILGESRWEIDNLRALGREKRIFKNTALQGLNEASLKSLNWEDNIFTQRAFKDALGQYMQANGLEAADDVAIAYAKRRALEATFKQTNELATILNNLKRKPIIGKLVEGAVPFTKTPANIVSRAVEYSPAGLMKTLYDVGAKKSAATVIEDLSKGLTGSAITALGFYLGASGWAKVERNRSEKAEGLMQEMGDQPNSIITPKGSYTFDWAQPFAVPLAMGIAASEAVKNRKDGDSLAQAVWDGIAAGGDTIFNMTMLQNIRQILGSSGSVTQKILGIPVSYVEQAIPSLAGQIARTADDTRRSTYNTNPAVEEWNKIKSRIPGLSQSLEPSLDIWGEEQSQGGIIQQFINPGYAKPRSDDPVTNEVARLYSSYKDTDMLPKTGTESFSADKVEYRLTPEQVTQFQRQMGQENFEEIGRLISSREYQRMADEQRVKRIKKIVNDNYDDMKEDIIKASALKGN